jgi:hypothetical protein
MKTPSASPAAQRQKVEVDVEVQRAAEALDERHSPRPTRVLRELCLPHQVGGDRPVYDAEHRAHSGRV